MNKTPWTIQWNGQVFTDAAATAGHVIAVADILEADVGFDVSPWDGPKQLAAWIAVLVAAGRVTAANAHEVELLVATALTEVYTATPAALLDSLSVRWPAPTGEAADVDDDDFALVGV